MFDWLRQWLADYGWWVFGVSLAMFVGSLWLVEIMLVQMPADYFARRGPDPESWRGRHPAFRTLGLIIKNLLGVVFLILGFVMLFTPGQGIISVLLGVSLMNFPGKRALERRIVSQPVVLKAINAIRARKGRPPLVVPRKKPHGTE
jgi:hypothetical protein